MRALLTFTALALSLSPVVAAEAQHAMVNVEDVTWKEGPPTLAGSQVSVLYGDPSKDGMFVMRVKLPANYKVPPHTHPGDEIVTVISGEFKFGMGKEFKESELKSFRTGALIAVPPKTEHFALTGQETVIQISTRGPWVLNFVNPNDKAQALR